MNFCSIDTAPSQVKQATCMQHMIPFTRHSGNFNKANRTLERMDEVRGTPEGNNLGLELEK